MSMGTKKKVVIVGGGFGGINTAKALSKSRDVEITLIDRRNYHLFQPLLYQVAMAALSPADIAAPIRHLFAKQSNINVINAEVKAVDSANSRVITTYGDYSYDYLVLACGAQHFYFGNEQWEDHAPGLKTIEQATEIRRRVLNAFERAETAKTPEEQKKHLTFVVVGGGPTGVELAGAIGEMSRYTLAKDFRKIDPRLTRIILIEAGPRILPSFNASLSQKSTRELESLGVQVWTSSMVTGVEKEGVQVGSEKISSSTVLWAAGVIASNVGNSLGATKDRQNRIHVLQDLSVDGYPNIFVIGDQAHFKEDGKPLPGVATVAIQQGRFLGKNIIADIKGKPRQDFKYFDKGQMATIGKKKAICQTSFFKLSGTPAWIAWLLVHIYYLAGFKNRLFVVLQWGWSYFTFRRGARLIIQKNWHSYPEASAKLKNLHQKYADSVKPGELLKKDKE